MRQICSLVLLTAVLAAPTRTARQGVADAISVALREHQYDLATDGRRFLLEQAANASFFMLGELHGDAETPALIRSLWPSMWKIGYRHVAAELSPWAASRLEFPAQDGAGSLQRSFSWSQADVRFIAADRRGKTPVLWGCDMEEPRPHELIRDLAAANPKSPELQAAVALAQAGYQRSTAPALLEHLQKAERIRDLSINGTSLRSNIIRTLEVERDRMSPDTRLRASTRRETLMKELFYQYWEQHDRPKVLLRFGGNHLHRGLDRRGVSTLGNFVAELAIARSLNAFNLAEVAGGGKIFWGGQVIDFAASLTDPALVFLGSIARHPATVFDLRPIRQALHRIPEDKRSAAESSLVYWADSYDAILFYRTVTPRDQ
jgi:hypothetical protein